MFNMPAFLYENHTIVIELIEAPVLNFVMLS